MSLSSDCATSAQVVWLRPMNDERLRWIEHAVYLSWATACVGVLLGVAALCQGCAAPAPYAPPPRGVGLDRYVLERWTADGDVSRCVLERRTRVIQPGEKVRVEDLLPPAEDGDQWAGAKERE